MEAADRQSIYQRLKPLKDMQEKIEKEIAAYEKKKLEIETSFSDQNTYKDDVLIQSLNIEYSRITPGSILFTINGQYGKKDREDYRRLKSVVDLVKLWR